MNGNLVVSRGQGQSVIIDLGFQGQIEIEVGEIRPNARLVRLVIRAPKHMNIRRSELEPIALGANSEKRTEDIGSAPGALSRKDAEAILRWRDDLDNTRFPVDLQAIVCRLASERLAEGR